MYARYDETKWGSFVLVSAEGDRSLPRKFERWEMFSYFSHKKIEGPCDGKIDLT